MSPRYWSCPCGSRNERIKQKCVCGRSRPKRRVPAHAKTLRDDSFDVYLETNRVIHGCGDECAICGRPPSQERRLDRDHDHKTGQRRGLLCVPCNKKLGSKYTIAYLRAAAEYLERVEAWYAEEAKAA